jgi:hypothetical protein
MEPRPRPPLLGLGHPLTTPPAPGNLRLARCSARPLMPRTKGIDAPATAPRRMETEKRRARRHMGYTFGLSVGVDVF